MLSTDKKSKTGYGNIESKKGSVVYGYTYLMDEKAFLLIDPYENCYINNQNVYKEGKKPSYLAEQNTNHYFRMQIDIEIQINGKW